MRPLGESGDANPKFINSNQMLASASSLVEIMVKPLVRVPLRFLKQPTTSHAQPLKTSIHLVVLGARFYLMKNAFISGLSLAFSAIKSLFVQVNQAGGFIRELYAEALSLSATAGAAHLLLKCYRTSEDVGDFFFKV